MRAQAFYLAGRATVQTLPTLEDLVDLHLVSNLHVLEIGKLQRAVFIQIWAHLGRCLQPLFNQLTDRVVSKLVNNLLRR